MNTKGGLVKQDTACQYCGRMFEYTNACRCHELYCKQNPNAKVKTRGKAVETACQYCGKVYHTEGGCKQHERYCKQNPNAEKWWSAGETIETNESLKAGHDLRKQRIDTGVYGPRKEFHHTEETKLLLSQKQKQYCLEHPEAHNWKKQDRNISVPCECLKKYFRELGMAFVEEYTPDGFNYSLDIAWPDLKVAVEVNGNQHYENDGSLKPYYQKRHDELEKAGWKIKEIHFSKCYKPKFEDFDAILKLDAYGKDYAGKYFSKREKAKQKKEQYKQQVIANKQKKQQFDEKIYNLLNNAYNSRTIDFTKFGHNEKVRAMLKQNGISHKGSIIRFIRLHAPKFLSEHTDIFNK